MPFSIISKGISKELKEASPLKEYWDSNQGEEDEKKRLLLTEEADPLSTLFRLEPYKWEVLYQSTLREIRKGDKESIKAMKVLLSMLRDTEKEKILSIYEERKLLTENIIKEIKVKIFKKESLKKNRSRFLRILIAIFTNPYRIELKGKRHHIYEHTGYIFNILWRLF